MEEGGRLIYREVLLILACALLLLYCSLHHQYHSWSYHDNSGMHAVQWVVDPPRRVESDGRAEVVKDLLLWGTRRWIY